jgi:hypothetical protein
MVKKSLLLAVLIAGIALPAGSDPAGFVFWKSAQLKAYAKQLSPKINAQKVALERLATYDNHLIMVVHREGDGEAEFHETQTDVFIAISGTATLVVGGTEHGPRGRCEHPVEDPPPSAAGRLQTGHLRNCESEGLSPAHFQSTQTGLDHAFMPFFWVIRA